MNTKFDLNSFIGSYILYCISYIASAVWKVFFFFYLQLRASSFYIHNYGQLAACKEISIKVSWKLIEV